MDFTQPRILCVDDNEDSCELISLMLGNVNGDYQVTTAASPEKALALIRDWSFDLYIIDYQFPDVSGIELCRQIRESDAQTPIMFYTAVAYSANRERALAAGANAYLVKPNDFDKLAETVKQLLTKPLARVAEVLTYSQNEPVPQHGLW